MMQKRFTDILQIETRMRPGEFSRHGFLGVSESLESVINSDAELLNQRNITYDEIADKIEEILLLVLKKRDEDFKSWFSKETRFPDLSRPETVPHFSLDNLPDIEIGHLVEKLHVFILQWRGVQGCPWGCSVDSKWASIDFLILNRETGDFFTGPGLAIHLIREHQFFEGKGTPYRVDPEKAIRTLELG